MSKSHFLGVLSISVGLIWMASLAFFTAFLATDVTMLGPEEQQKIKSGKLFWEWSSPYGPLAMHYVEKGKGSKHILLLHGFRAHTYTWRHLIDPLVQSGYHVWAIDYIGYGLSDKPDHAVYDFDFFVQQIEAFMKAHTIPKAHLIGSSLGGGLALKMALAFPERVTSLTLLDALGYPLNLPFYLSIGRYIHQIWAPFLKPGIVRRSLNEIIFNSELVTDEQVEAYSLPYRFPGGISATLLTLQQFDNEYLVEMSHQYPDLNHPTLVIWGDQDRLIPTSHYEKFQKDFPHAKCLLIKDCGHIPQEEAPQQVIPALSAFLQNIEQSSIKTN